MTTKTPRPSPDQWARLDAALQGLPERTPPGISTLTREISRRADALRAALESGWRMKDLAAFFSDSAGINVSPSTIQTALQRALAETTSDRRRPRAKRPRKKSSSGNGPAAKKKPVDHAPARHALSPAENADRFVERAQPLRPTAPVSLGSTLTQGATKRGQR
ncbi:hypothetical protein [Paraburkholderia sacchari]|uniref:hypothetical protein n=1 Tax=Paraburkholderia sacchari TaxID=159450 RepID=UPI001BCE249C|nr:hypothetical protein [Paraburkholderia sacchari]